MTKRVPMTKAEIAKIKEMAAAGASKAACARAVGRTYWGISPYWQAVRPDKPLIVDPLTRSVKRWLARRPIEET